MQCRRPTKEMAPLSPGDVQPKGDALVTLRLHSNVRLKISENFSDGAVRITSVVYSIAA